jgi:hypothetical protein
MYKPGHEGGMHKPGHEGGMSKPRSRKWGQKFI